VPRFLQIDTQRHDLMSTPFMFHYEDSQQSPFHSLCQGESRTSNLPVKPSSTPQFKLKVSLSLYCSQ
jgi:hypothetical protein